MHSIVYTLKGRRLRCNFRDISTYRRRKARKMLPGYRNGSDRPHCCRRTDRSATRRVERTAVILTRMQVSRLRTRPRPQLLRPRQRTSRSKPRPRSSSPRPEPHAAAALAVPDNAQRMNQHLRSSQVLAASLTNSN